MRLRRQNPADRRSERLFLLKNVVNTPSLNEKFNQEQKTSQGSTSMNVRKTEAAEDCNDYSDNNAPDKS
jgi:hypothetical protein